MLWKELNGQVGQIRMTPQYEFLNKSRNSWNIEASETLENLLQEYPGLWSKWSYTIESTKKTQILPNK